MKNNSQFILKCELTDATNNQNYPLVVEMADGILSIRSPSDSGSEVQIVGEHGELKVKVWQAGNNSWHKEADAIFLLAKSVRK